jgi:hypothetical protein
MVMVCLQVLVTGYVSAQDFDRIVNPAAMAGQASR